MAYLSGIQSKGEVKDIRQVMSCLYQLEEQVRYALQNLDGDNIRPGAIGETQLNGTVSERLAAMESNWKETQAAVSRMNGTLTRLNAALSRLATAAAQILAGSLPFDIYVGADAPEGTQVLWIIPGEADENGRQPCTVKYIPEPEEEEEEEEEPGE